MKKSTEDILKGSVEDTHVAAVVIVMTTEGIHLPSSGTCHPVIHDDAQDEGINNYIWLIHSLLQS